MKINILLSSHSSLSPRSKISSSKMLPLIAYSVSKKADSKKLLEFITSSLIKKIYAKASRIQISQRLFSVNYITITLLEESKYTLENLKLSDCKLIGSVYSHAALPSEFMITFLDGIIELDNVYANNHSMPLAIYFNGGDLEAPDLSINTWIIGAFYLSPVILLSLQNNVESKPKDEINLRMDKVERKQKEHMKILKKLIAGYQELRAVLEEQKSMLNTISQSLQNHREKRPEKLYSGAEHAIQNCNQRI